MSSSETSISRESTPNSNSIEIEDVDITDISDEKLKALLLKEVEITKKIDDLIKEIDKMDDLRTIGDENPQVITEPRKKEVNNLLNYLYRKNIEEEEEEEEEEEDADLDNNIDEDSDEEDDKKEAEKKKNEEENEDS